MTTIFILLLIVGLSFGCIDKGYSVEVNFYDGTTHTYDNIVDNKEVSFDTFYLYPASGDVIKLHRVLSIKVIE